MKLYEILEEIEFKSASDFDSVIVAWKNVRSLLNDDSDCWIDWSLTCTNQIDFIVINLWANSADLAWLNYMNISSVDQWVQDTSSESEIVCWIGDNDWIAWGW